MIVSAGTLAGQHGKVAARKASKAQEGLLAATMPRSRESALSMTIPPGGV